MSKRSYLQRIEDYKNLDFEDENYIEMYDFEHSIEEDRYIAIGCVGDVLFVVFKAILIPLIEAEAAPVNL